MKSINLNLLRTLQVLLDECHVSRTAEHLCITQSAVSRQLNQLRELFGDPLLVRDGNRLLPTPKAQQLKQKLDGLLAECQELFVSDEFEPQSWEGRVVLSSSDYVAQYILPEIVERVQRQAPNLKLAYQLWSPDQFSRLADLDIQLVSTMLSSIPPGVCGTQIGADYPVCVMRRSHPLAENETMSAVDFIRYGHMSVSGGGDKDSFVDKELAERGLSRRIQFSVPFFSSAFQTVCRTDMLMVIPEHIASNMQQMFPIIYKPLPFNAPEHRYWLLWHPRFDSDPSHRWLRELVLAVMQSSMYSISMISDHNCDEFF
ncbi:Transcriptional regulator, LysR family [Photobacterium marinum]|uniref:Transcriptional regulator, LysR family n=1 Tax=Photobacterium marinum TaxID=1056511 RepID=L8J745_9GAMM|nr:LysR family transcriptional regulator [Photobacterium marinum]ELR63414.1 Transcriptional regulator, LysR family [Photobacterium marinum]